MPAKTNNCSTYIALLLAATTAIVSAQDRVVTPSQELQWLLLTGGAPEAAATAGAIGDRAEAVPVP